MFISGSSVRLSGKPGARSSEIFMKGVKARTVKVKLFGKPVRIGLRVYDRVTDLRGYIHQKYPTERGIRHMLAYAETFHNADRAGRIGIVHLPKRGADLDTIAHESVHIASGIIATRYPGAVFTPTNDRAEHNEECFADAVGRFTHSIWKEFNSNA
jgi:hypothetical protein